MYTSKMLITLIVIMAYNANAGSATLDRFLLEHLKGVPPYSNPKDLVMVREVKGDGSGRLVQYTNSGTYGDLRGFDKLRVIGFIVTGNYVGCPELPTSGITTKAPGLIVGTRSADCKIVSAFLTLGDFLTSEGCSAY